MGIFRFIYCLFNGHAYIDIVDDRRPYQYCLRCGKIEEPVAVLKRVTVSTHQ
jgi:hypothetical protein